MSGPNTTKNEAAGTCVALGPDDVVIADGAFADYQDLTTDTRRPVRISGRPMLLMDPERAVIVSPDRVPADAVRLDVGALFAVPLVGDRWLLMQPEAPPLVELTVEHLDRDADAEDATTDVVASLILPRPPKQETSP